MNRNGRPQKKGLKESLRSILRRKHDKISNDTIGSGILKRNDPSLLLLPNVSKISLLPDFESSRFDIDQYSVATIDCVTNIPISVRAYGGSKQSLLPKTSLSQFEIDVQTAYQYQSQLSELATLCSTRSISRPRTSTNEIFSTPQNLNRSASTLRLQRSTQTLRSPIQNIRAPSLIHISSQNVPETLPSPTQTPRRNLKRTPSSISARQQPTSIEIPRIIEPSPSKSSISDRSISEIEHFSSFCVLDTFTPGCPVTMTSKDLRFVFDIGEQFCLNSEGVEGASMDTVTGSDIDGNPITHLVLYSPLINPSSGRTRFVLASLIDVTPFLKDAASVPDLETISEESVIEEELRTPPKWSVGTEASFQFSAESLLSGCCLPERMPVTPTRKPSQDIWLDIATEETKRSRSSSRSPCRSITSRTNTTPSSLNLSVDDMLDDFIAGLQELYSEFFILGKSPFDENSYEICNVSPRVHDNREYIDGHLSHTSKRSKEHLERKLTYEEPFSMNVRWGQDGIVRRMFCIPLFGRNNITWACFLVDPRTNHQALPEW